MWSLAANHGNYKHSYIYSEWNDIKNKRKRKKKKKEKRLKEKEMKMKDNIN